jgi:hypothetical protein
LKRKSKAIWNNDYEWVERYLDIKEKEINEGKDS